jgi:hypothetical protein
VFGDESYIHHQTGEIIPATNKGLFYFFENDIEAVESND